MPKEFIDITPETLVPIYEEGEIQTEVRISDFIHDYAPEVDPWEVSTHLSWMIPALDSSTESMEHLLCAAINYCRPYQTFAETREGVMAERRRRGDHI